MSAMVTQAAATEAASVPPGRYARPLNRRARLSNAVFFGLCVAFALVAIGLLVCILGFVLYKGVCEPVVEFVRQSTKRHALGDAERDRRDGVSDPGGERGGGADGDVVRGVSGGVCAG